MFDTTRKLSSVLASRKAIIPVSVAALAPFAIAGALWVPFDEVISVLKKLLLL